MSNLGSKMSNWDIDASYQAVSEKGQPNGYASLDANGQVPAAQIPAGGGGVPSTRLINTTAPIAGGGDLSADRTLSLNDNGVTYAKMQDVSAASKLLGRGDSGSGDPQEITLGSGLTMTGTTLATSGGSGLSNDSLMLPPFFNHANLTAVTAFATNTSYFVYFGRVSTAITTLTLRNRVTTAAATITWAEVGVFTGSPVLAGNSSLTRRGFTNVAATFNSAGQKSTVIALTGVSANDELWLAFGSQATTPYQCRGGLADDLQTGWYASVAGRISTLGTPVTVTLASATLVPPWCAIKI